MLAQVDGALSTWRLERGPVDDFIRVAIRDNEALNDARQATKHQVASISGIGTAIGLMVLAFFMFGLILRPVVKLANVGSKLAAGDSATIVPTRRRDEFGQLSGALAAWQRSSQNLVDGLRDGHDLGADGGSRLGNH